jgi:uncharacterized protein YerC
MDLSRALKERPEALQKIQVADSLTMQATARKIRDPTGAATKTPNIESR